MGAPLCGPRVPLRVSVGVSVRCCVRTGERPAPNAATRRAARRGLCLLVEGLHVTRELQGYHGFSDSWNVREFRGWGQVLVFLKRWEAMMGREPVNNLVETVE